MSTRSPDRFDRAALRKPSKPRFAATAWESPTCRQTASRFGMKPTTSPKSRPLPAAITRERSEGYLTRALNRPFERPTSHPFRFAAIDAGPQSHYVVLAYDHWVADSLRGPPGPAKRLGPVSAVGDLAKTRGVWNSTREPTGRSSAAAARRGTGPGGIPGDEAMESQSVCLAGGLLVEHAMGGRLPSVPYHSGHRGPAAGIRPGQRRDRPRRALGGLRPGAGRGHAFARPATRARPGQHRRHAEHRR